LKIIKFLKSDKFVSSRFKKLSSSKHYNFDWSIFS